jgi:hypothetical protein
MPRPGGHRVGQRLGMVAFLLDPPPRGVRIGERPRLAVLARRFPWLRRVSGHSPSELHILVAITH